MTYSATNAANVSPEMEGLGRLRALSFPESFQRSRTKQSYDDCLSANGSPSSLEMQSSSSSDQMTPASETGSPDPERSSSGAGSRSRDVMRLENILNDVSLGERSTSHSQERSLSVGISHPDDGWSSESGPSSNSMGQSIRSESPDAAVKRKKVKLHRCPECSKDFPRPSGLRTHMNTHTRERPYPCTFPGCDRSFSVVSNAKRHMRTHGLGVPSEDAAGMSRVPYVVDFEPPIVAPSKHTPKQSDPVKLRWPTTQDKRSNLSASPASSLGTPSSASDTDSRKNSNIGL